MTKQHPVPSKNLVKQAVSALREKRHEDAVKLCEKILETDPRNAKAAAIAFSAHFKLQHYESARKIGGLAAELNPTSEYILNNQACLQLEAQQSAAASGLLKSLIEQYGEKPHWLYNLGLAQRKAGSNLQSITVLERTLSLAPKHDKAVFQLAQAYQQVGQLEHANARLKYLRLLRHNHAATHSEFIHHAAITSSLSKESLMQEIGHWGALFIPRSKPYTPKPSTNRQHLKLGFIVGEIPDDYWYHMLLPVLNKLSENCTVQILRHSTNQHTEDLQEAIAIEECEQLSDAEFTTLVRDMSLDVVIDVCGMSAGCRQRSLGVQLASKQYGWLVHEGAYATENVDILEPLLQDQRFCITNPKLLNVQARAKNPNILFGLNTQSGLTDQCVKVWAGILQQRDDFELNLDASDTIIQKQIRSQFNKLDISEFRLKFDPMLRPGLGSMVLENLDNNNVVKTHAALHRGAAVVALRGDLFASQQSSDLLEQLGRGDWVVDNHDDYQNKILEIADSTYVPNVSIESLNHTGISNAEAYAARLLELFKA